MRARAWARLGAAFGHPLAVTPVTAPRALLYAALALLGVTIALFRLPFSSLDSLWTDDGAIFLEQAARAPLGSTLGQGYAGYAHLVPRLVAEITVRLFPIQDAAVATSAIMAVLLSALALAIFFLSGAHLRRLPARLLLWLLIVAAPLAGMEVVLSTANFQWYLLVGSFFAVMCRRGGRTASAVSAIVLGVAVASSALALLFLPLVAVRANRFRRPGDWAVLGSGLLAAVFQVWVIAHSVRAPHGAYSALDFVPTYLVEVIGVGWVGPYPVRTAYGHSPIGFLVVAALLLVLTGWLAWRSRRSTALGLVALGGSIAFYLIIAALSGFVSQPLLWLEVGLGTRYYLLPVVLIGAVIVAGVEHAMGSPVRTMRLLGVGLIVLQLLVVVSSYRLFDPRASDLPPGSPTWHTAVTLAREECAATGEREVYLRGTPRSPDVEAIVLPCLLVLTR